MTIDPRTIILAFFAAAVIYLLLKRQKERQKDAPPRLHLHTLPQNARDEMQGHLNAGRKVDAIRVISQKAGVSIKEAKEFIEAVQEERA